MQHVFLVWLAFLFACVGGWVTHIVWLIGLLTGPTQATINQIALGVIAAVVPFIGMIHGWMIWFGAGY